MVKRKTARRRRGGDFLGIGNFFKHTIPSAAKTVYNKALKPTANWIRDNKVLSTAAGYIPHPAGTAVSTGLKLVGLGRRRRVGRPRKRGRGPLMNAALFAVQKLRALARRSGFGKKRVVRKRVVRKRGGFVMPKGGYPKGLLRGMIAFGKKRRAVRRKRGGENASRSTQARSILTKINGLLRQHKVVSRGLSHFGYKRAASVAGLLGYGRKRRVRRRGRGDDYPDVAPARPPHALDGYVDAAAPRAWYKSLAGIHNKIRDERFVSRGLAKLKLGRLSRAAKAVGYGRHHGGANFFSTQQIAVPKY